MDVVSPLEWQLAGHEERRHLYQLFFPLDSVSRWSLLCPLTQVTLRAREAKAHLPAVPPPQLYFRFGLLSEPFHTFLKGWKLQVLYQKFVVS